MWILITWPCAKQDLPVLNTSPTFRRAYEELRGASFDGLEGGVEVAGAAAAPAPSAPLFSRSPSWLRKLVTSDASSLIWARWLSMMASCSLICWHGDIYTNTISKSHTGWLPHTPLLLMSADDFLSNKCYKDGDVMALIWAAPLQKENDYKLKKQIMSLWVSVLQRDLVGWLTH